MKIIHCLNHFLPDHIAGTEVYVWALCKQLAFMGFEVGVVIPNYLSITSKDYVYDDIPVHCYAEPSASTRDIVTGRNLTEGIENFRRYIEQARPQVVHFHEISGSNGISVTHFEIARRAGCKVVFTIHLSGNSCRSGTLMYEGRSACDGVISEQKCSYCTLVQKTGSKFKAKIISQISSPLFTMGFDTLRWQNKLGTALSYPLQVSRLRKDLKRIERACDTIIPITNWYANILRSNGINEEKIKVVLQALPTSVERPIKEKQELITRPLKLTFIGRIDELKGINILIDALKHFSQDQLEVDIYGHAPDASYLEQCISITKSMNYIRWKGTLAQNDVVSTLAEYDFLLLPSLFSEMSPLVIQEAFAAGVPVIGSNVYGIAEQVKHGINGFLFDFGNAGSLRSVLQHVIDQKEMVKTLSENIKEPRSFSAVGKETADIYRLIMGEKEVIAG